MGFLENDLSLFSQVVGIFSTKLRTHLLLQPCPSVLHNHRYIHCIKLYILVLKNVALSTAQVPFKIDDWLELTAAEITALLHVPPHPCVMQLYGITVKLVRGELELVLVTEYIHKGNGNQFLDGAKEKSRWSLDDRVLICYTIGQGLEHLHTLNPPIIHRRATRGTGGAALTLSLNLVQMYTIQTSRVLFENLL